MAKKELKKRRSFYFENDKAELLGIQTDFSFTMNILLEYLIKKFGYVNFSEALKGYLSDQLISEELIHNKVTQNPTEFEEEEEELPEMNVSIQPFLKNKKVEPVVEQPKPKPEPVVERRLTARERYEQKIKENRKITQEQIDVAVAANNAPYRSDAGMDIFTGN